MLALEITSFTVSACEPKEILFFLKMTHVGYKNMSDVGVVVVQSI
jgi:hypothetical protein